MEAKYSICAYDSKSETVESAGCNSLAKATKIVKLFREKHGRAAIYEYRGTRHGIAEYVRVNA